MSSPTSTTNSPSTPASSPFSQPFSKPLIISVVVAILLLGMNMRSPIVGFGAVANLVQADLQISTKMIGFIGALPMLAFAFSSFLAPNLSKKIGLEPAMLLAAVLLTVGIIGRIWLPDVGLLLVGTTLLCLAISIGNVLIPAVIKKYTPQKISFIMGMYSLTLSVFAGVASGVAMPLVGWHSWQFALGIWGVLGVLAILAWLWVNWQVKNTASAVATPLSDTDSPNSHIPVTPAARDNTPTVSVWRMKMPWWISGFMGLQSLLYYTVASFLPSLLIDKGLTPQEAGNVGMYFQFMAFPSIMLLTRWVAKGNSLRVLGMAAALGNLIGVIGFGFLSVKLAWLWAVCAGFGCGVIFTLSMMIFTLKARDSVQAAELSGMAQSVGYGIAIFGPFGVGWLKDVSGNWVIPSAVLVVLMVLGCVCAWFATEDKELS